MIRTIIACILLGLLSTSGVQAKKKTTASVRGAARKLQTCEFEVELENKCSFRRIRNEVRDSDQAAGCRFRSIKNKLKAACAAADAGDISPTPGSSLHQLIDRFGESDITTFYEGGTAWNDNTGPLDEEAPEIEEIFEEYAEDTQILFPTQVPFLNNCQLPAVMCLWTRDRQADDDNGNCETPYAVNCVDADPADNTDLCYVNTPSGQTFYPEEEEGDVHAHGFVLSETSTPAAFRGNNLFYVSMYDHLSQRGYVDNADGAPMCGCLENMPSVSRSDCTQIDTIPKYVVSFADGVASVKKEYAVEFNACDGDTENDLYSELVQQFGEDGLDASVRGVHLVGPEDNDEESNCLLPAGFGEEEDSEEGSEMDDEGGSEEGSEEDDEGSEEDDEEEEEDEE